jgi:hypothetical protein
MKIKSGGGITSNKLVQDRKYKQEPVTHKASPAGVAQQGMAVQFRKELLQQGPHSGYEQPKITKPTGIANATYNSAKSGPGSQRAIYKSGSQSPCPPAHGMPAGRDTLSEFGGDVPGRRGNR